MRIGVTGRVQGAAWCCDGDQAALSCARATPSPLLPGSTLELSHRKGGAATVMSYSSFESDALCTWEEW